MNYQLVQPPLMIPFEQMTRPELKNHYQWFLNAIPERIRILSQAVKETSGFEMWIPDATPASLDMLDEWFVLQVKTRPCTEEEIKEKEKIFSKAFPQPVKLSDITDDFTKFTEETLSIIIDIGMYISQVFVTNHPSLKWKLVTGSKRDINYGKPVLSGFEVDFEPVRMISVQAPKVTDKTKTRKGLRKLYEIWAKEVK